MLSYPVASEVDTAVRALVRLVGAGGKVRREILPLTAMATVVVTLCHHQITITTVGLCVCRVQYDNYTTGLKLRCTNYIYISSKCTFLHKFAKTEYLVKLNLIPLDITSTCMHVNP